MAANVKKAVEEQYDKTSPEKRKKYSDPIQSFYYKHIVVDKILGSLTDSLAPGSRVLDIGTGAGLYPYHLSDSAYEVCGIDISRQALLTANEAATSENVSYVLGDGEALCFKDDTFDGILAVGTFEYVSDLDSFLTEVARVSSRDARFVFTVHNENAYSSTGRSSPIPTARHSIEKLEGTLSRHGFVLESYRTTHFVSQYQKLLFLSERVPWPVRWLSVYLTVKANNCLERVPYVNERGESMIVVSNYEPSE